MSDSKDAPPPVVKREFGTGSYRCNARPINPFVVCHTPEQEILNEVFECDGWKVSKNKEKGKRRGGGQ